MKDRATIIVSAAWPLYARILRWVDPDDLSDPGAYFAALYVGPHKVRDWPFDPPDGVQWTAERFTQRVRDFVSDKVRALYGPAAGQHFGPRPGWSPELQAILSFNNAEAAASAVTIHPEDVKTVDEERRLARAAAPQPRKSRRRVSPRCALYRHYDSDDVLLYIGITHQQSSRDADHRFTSGWMTFVERTEAQWFPTREDALTAERAAIETEGPVFNRQHALNGREDRVRGYLDKVGCADLTPKFV